MPADAIDVSALYCPRHSAQAAAFATLDTAQISSHAPSLYDAVNRAPLQHMQGFVRANGEVNLFTLSDDNMLCVLKRTLDAAPDATDPDLARFYHTTAVAPVDDAAELAAVTDFVDAVLDTLETRGAAAALAHLAAHNVQHAPLKVDRFQHREDGALRCALHVDTEGTVMPEVFYNGAGTYGREDYAPSFDRVRDAYQAHMRAMFTVLGGDADALSADAFAVESALARVAETPSEKRHGYCTRGAVREQGAFVRDFVAHWVCLLGNNADDTDHTEDADADNIDNIVVFRGKAVHSFDTVVRDHTHALPAYLTWLCLSHFALLASSTTGALRAAHADFHLRCLRGQHEPRPRWYDALAWMKNNMQDNMALLLRDRGPDNRARRDATVAMVKEMTAAAAEEIDEVRHWPGLDDANARAKLQAHIRAIDVSVGFPAALRAVAYGLRADAGVVASMLRVGRQNAREVLASVRAQPGEFLWVMNPLTANACYNISTHSIIITEAMTLPPFFGQGARFITGHEITHSIDDQGAAKIAEMPAAAREGFAALCQRMVAWNRALKQQPAAAQGDVAPEEDLTLGENIADLIGFRIALREFQARFAREHGGQEPEEVDIVRCYAMFARLWAAETSEVLRQTRDVSDAHEPPATRVAMATAGLPVFLEAMLGGDAESGAVAS